MPELVKKITEGHSDVFTSLYYNYHAELCEFAYWFTRNSAVSEDIVHEVFLNIWRNREHWKPDGNLSSYLYRCVKNEALNYLKHQKVVRKWEKESRYSDSESHATPEESYIESELSLRISTVLDQLPEQRKKIFLLSRDAGLSYREISEILGISVKTVETQISRTLKVLKENLKDYL